MADETAPPKTPIFFAVTRSFILGIVPVLIAAADLIVAISTGEASGPVADFLTWTFGWSPEQATKVVRGVGTVAALIIAQQRSGAARPYTMEISKETMK
jgi:hypothetical protein